MKSILFIAVLLLLMPEKVQTRRIHSFLVPNTLEKEVTTVSRRDEKRTELPDDEKHDIHPFNSLIHGVEVAEKVLVEAIRDEVETLFHDKDHEKNQVSNPLMPVKASTIRKVSLKNVPDPMDDYIHLNQFPYRPEVYGPDIRH